MIAMHSQTPDRKTNTRLGGRLRLTKKFSGGYKDIVSPTASQFGENIKNIFRWKGSIYSLMWKEFLIYIVLYIFLTVLYDFVLTDTDRTHFEDVAAYCSSYVSSLQIVLLLGFFTSTSMQRWFSIVQSMPGTSKVTAYFVNSLKENQPDGVQIVQQYARWIVLSWTLAFRLICPSLKEAYPELICLQNEGLLLEHERLQLEMEPYEKNQSLIVINWNLALLRVCGRRNMYIVPADYSRNLDCLMLFKKNCNHAIKFATKNIPFALIQAVSVAVYSYGLASLMARQPTTKAANGTRNHTPVFAILGFIPFTNAIKFFLFYSWLKFGRMASNPFGEDDDDINVKQLLYSHIEDAVRLQSLYVDNSSIEKVAMTSVNQPSQLWIDHATMREKDGKRKTITDIRIQQSEL